MTHPLSRPCCSCEVPTPPQQIDLDRRIEFLSVTRMDGRPVTQVNIQTSEAVAAYCCESCWNLASVALEVALDLKSTYPSIGFVGSCSRCGSSIDRTKPYLCYSIAQMAYPKTGGDVVICEDARDWAVLCHECSASTASDEVFDSSAEPVAASARELT